MSTKIRKRNGKYRVVQSENPGRLARDQVGRAIDRGGHNTRSGAGAHSNALNKQKRK